LGVGLPGVVSVSASAPGPSSVLDRGVDPRALRYLFLSVHYRQKLNFTFDSLAAAGRALERVDEMRFRVEHATPDEDGEGEAEGGSRVAAAAVRLREDFAAALADDLNASKALAAVFGFVRETNVAVEEGLTAGDRERVFEALADVDRVLGVLDPAAWQGGEEGGDGDSERAEIDGLVERREAARQARDWAEADCLRDELAERGVVVEDTPQGPRWKKR
jgi:cysteinyl-tRNA synthetase